MSSTSKVTAGGEVRVQAARDTKQHGEPGGGDRATSWAAREPGTAGEEVRRKLARDSVEVGRRWVRGYRVIFGGGGGGEGGWTGTGEKKRPKEAAVPHQPTIQGPDRRRTGNVLARCLVKVQQQH